MKVQSILLAKGSRVATIRPDATVANAIHRLKVENIGALIVSTDGRTMLGLVSEREIIRALADRGPVLLEERVESMMAREVPTCAPQDQLTSVMAKMTRSRSRQVPVIEGGVLAGIVSIGDLVKHRLEELKSETDVLRFAAERVREIDRAEEAAAYDADA